MAEGKTIPSACFPLVRPSSWLRSESTLSAPPPSTPMCRQTSITAWTILGSRSLCLMYVCVYMCSYTCVCWFCSSGGPNASTRQLKKKKRIKEIPRQNVMASGLHCGSRRSTLETVKGQVPVSTAYFNSSCHLFLLSRLNLDRLQKLTKPQSLHMCNGNPISFPGWLHKAPGSQHHKQQKGIDPQSGGHNDSVIKVGSTMLSQVK